MSGSLRPSLSFQRIGSPTSEHELSLFNSFPCPKSAILVKSVNDHLIPLVSPGGKLYGKLSVVSRLFPQNWQIAATYLAETALAVGQITNSSAAFWEAGLALFEEQQKGKWGNERVQELSAREIRREGAEVVAAAFKGRDDISITAEEIIARTTNTPKIGPGASSAVTQDLLYNIKFARQISIQHTPSLALDGIVQGHNFDGGIVNGISSSWGKEEWESWLRDVVKVDV